MSLLTGAIIRGNGPEWRYEGQDSEELVQRPSRKILLAGEQPLDQNSVCPKSGVKFAIFMQICQKNGYLPRRFMQQLIKFLKGSFSLPKVLVFELDARFSLPSSQLEES